MRIPIFPLPGAVLFPGTLLPLHVFEPRYRELVETALAGDRLIGMVMLEDASEAMAPPPAAPTVRPVGGAGRIVEHERLEDGRFNIVLQGEFRFRILGEEPPAPYRVAHVELYPAPGFETPEAEREEVAHTLGLFDDLRAAMELPPLPGESLALERLCGELATRLRWDPPEMQEVLELATLPAQIQAIGERLARWKEALDFLHPFRAGAAAPLWN